MKARLIVLLLWAVVGCAGGAEPRERPRLAPSAADEEKPAAGGESRLERAPAFAPQFRSFESFLQAEARRPVGLGPARETSGNDPAMPRETTPAPTRKDAGHAAGGEVLILPTVEVTTQKVPAVAARLADLESQLRSGDQASVETWLDSILNPVFLFGESAKVRAARAKRRGEVLGWQKIMLLALETEQSPEEKARIEADIVLLNTILRSWK
jgi:hypothetical protein